MNATKQRPQHSEPLSESQERTSSWRDILLLIFAGILAATQIGKAHIALPDIEAKLSSGLAHASWIISELSVMAVFFAVPAGVFASNWFEAGRSFRPDRSQPGKLRR